MSDERNLALVGALAIGGGVTAMLLDPPTSFGSFGLFVGVVGALVGLGLLLAAGAMIVAARWAADSDGGDEEAAGAPSERAPAWPLGPYRTSAWPLELAD